jgi:serine/threonine protein kinase
MDLALHEMLGEGSGSKVWKGQWGHSVVAVKVLKVNPHTRKEALRGFVQEATILSQLRHPAICTLLGMTLHEGLPALVLEFMGGGSLFDLLHNSNSTLTPPLLSRLALEVATGISYLHAHSVIHRDIKSANVLLDDRMHAKVSDFGISTRFGTEHTAETGTYRSMAPEVIAHHSYDHRCDVFSFAVLLWEMAHRQIPFGHESGLQAAFAVAVEKRRPPIRLPALLDGFGSLITRAWAHDPATRPSMASITAEIQELDAKVKADCSAALFAHASLQVGVGADTAPPAPPAPPAL